MNITQLLCAFIWASDKKKKTHHPTLTQHKIKWDLILRRTHRGRLCDVMLLLEPDWMLFWMSAETQTGLGFGVQDMQREVLERAAEVFGLFNLQNRNCRQRIKKEKCTLPEVTQTHFTVKSGTGTNEIQNMN